MAELNLWPILKEHFSKGAELYSISLGKCFISNLNYSSNYPILIVNEKRSSETLDICGYVNTGVGECNIYPSKTDKDWSKFLHKKDLPEGTPVMIRFRKNSDWILAKYKYRGCVQQALSKFYNQPEFIVPFDKFDPLNIEDSVKRRFIYNELLDLSLGYSASIYL